MTTLPQVLTLSIRSFTSTVDNQSQVQFPVFQGERVNCEDNTSLGEFTLAPIPPMKAGEPVLEVVFEVDVNGILKVTATEKSSGRSANITISNSVGKLSSAEIEKMVDGGSISGFFVLLPQTHSSRVIMTFRHSTPLQLKPPSEYQCFPLTLPSHPLAKNPTLFMPSTD